jgi:hypothetical protein
VLNDSARLILINVNSIYSNPSAKIISAARPLSSAPISK